LNDGEVKESGMSRASRIGLSLLTGVVLAVSAVAGAATETGKVPITTRSDEARTLYLQGRDLTERLRATDARSFFEQALTKDKDFALAYLGLANAANTAKEFFDAASRGAALADKVSPGERDMLLAVEAAAKGDVAGQERHLTALVAAFPNDERAQTLLGTYYFGRQAYGTAIEHFTKATTINPAFTQPYNLLGYSNRFLARYPEAERAFQKYIQLIPTDPNPYDSYAELLMKMGRFDESIQNYEKALAIDPHFIASLIGIANDQTFQGKTDAARATLLRLDSVARNPGERRQARLWTASAWVHDKAWDKAIAEVEKMVALAEAQQDLAAVSGDRILIGDILRTAGRLDEAAKAYAASVTAMDGADVPDEVKAATRRNLIREQGRLALARKDIQTAKAKSAEYAKQVAVKANPFEQFQVHQLVGLVALAENDAATAAAELKKANSLDPQVLYELALATKAAGDAAGARALAAKAADFNAFNFNYGFVRAKAKALVAAP
jgi:tetratricopeptide (TPR) repeat protein